ncbi:hypothetical protein QP164_00140 [Sphingomonas sp. LR59]|uniref:hypothetical protein n=1 Tax=Sphingomonas sp. LR59 TaxID=3050232 RepID=UPI002FE0ACB0
MRLEARVDRLEEAVPPDHRTHVILRADWQPEDRALDGYGRHRVEPGDEVKFIVLTGGDQ